MSKIIRSWSEGNIMIAVEAGKDDSNREGPHVHIYKNDRRTDGWISTSKTIKGWIDNKELKIAERLFDAHFSEIKALTEDIKDGKYDG